MDYNYLCGYYCKVRGMGQDDFIILKAGKKWFTVMPVGADIYSIKVPKEDVRPFEWVEKRKYVQINNSI